MPLVLAAVVLEVFGVLGGTGEGNEPAGRVSAASVPTAVVSSPE